jgi:H+/Cl- antiporter ClcA
MSSTDSVATRADALLRSRRFIGLLVVAAVLGGLVSAAAYGFLALIHGGQVLAFTDIPHGLGFSTAPDWWPLVPLLVAGVIVGLTVVYLPGAGGAVPVYGFHAGEKVVLPHLPGIAIAALASIALGPVVGPEAPLIALGAGLAVALMKLTRRDLPEQAMLIFAATGSFAAISTLLGSPIVGAFLLLEITGLAGATASVVLVPGLLGAGIGALIFTGLGSLTGQGEFSLAIPDLPSVSRPTIAEFGWALVIGLLAAPLCKLIRLAALSIRGLVTRYTLVATIAIALIIAGLAAAYAAVTGHVTADVLFSGQDQLPGLLENGTTYSVGALLFLLLCKSLAYSGSLIAFRGGPTFPAMFIGAVGGMAMSHLPGLQLISGAAMGIGAMSVGMLRLPMTCVLLTCLFLGEDGIEVMSLVIVAVVVSHVFTIRLTPPVASDAAASPPPDAASESAAPA